MHTWYTASMAIFRASGQLLQLPSSARRTEVVSQLRRRSVLMPWPLASMKDSRSDCTSSSSSSRDEPEQQVLVWWVV